MEYNDSRVDNWDCCQGAISNWFIYCSCLIPESKQTWITLTQIESFPFAVIAWPLLTSDLIGCAVRILQKLSLHLCWRQRFALKWELVCCVLIASAGQCQKRKDEFTHESARGNLYNNLLWQKRSSCFIFGDLLLNNWLSPWDRDGPMKLDKGLLHCCGWLRDYPWWCGYG